MSALAAWFAERWLVKRAAPVWAFIKGNPWRAACILALLWGLWGYFHGQACQTFKTNVIAAQRGSAAAQVAVNHEPARVSGQIASKSNAEAPAYYRLLADAAADHAVRLPSPTGPVGDPGVRGADPTQPGVHGPDEHAGAPDADLVCRPAADDGWLVWAAGRAAQMHAEADALITAGAAVPATPSK